MAITHRIRLNGPWQVHLSRTVFCADDLQQQIAAAESTTSRIKLPTDWKSFLAEQTVAHFCFTRPFNFPHQLEQGEFARICFEELSDSSVVILNDHKLTLAKDAERSSEITTRLNAHNRLHVLWSSEQLTETDAAPFTGAHLSIERRSLGQDSR